MNNSEDKTAERFIEYHIDASDEVDREKLKSLLEAYGNLRFNKAIEEAVAIAESNGNFTTAHDINKLKV